MKVLYIRISSADGQKMDRQRIIQKEFDKVVEDVCSGAIAFFDRPGGKEIKQFAEKGAVKEIACMEISRLGRSLLDILSTIKYFTDKNIAIHFISQGLRTIDSDGKENTISKMVVSMLGMVADLERQQIKERQAQGIAIARSKGLYSGRKQNTKEDSLRFLSKPKNAKALQYLKKGIYKNAEVAKICNLNPNTIAKIKRVGLMNQSN